MQCGPYSTLRASLASLLIDRKRLTWGMQLHLLLCVFAKSRKRWVVLGNGNNLKAASCSKSLISKLLYLE